MDSNKRKTVVMGRRGQNRSGGLFRAMAAALRLSDLPSSAMRNSGKHGLMVAEVYRGCKDPAAVARMRSHRHAARVGRGAAAQKRLAKKNRAIRARSPK